MTALEALVHNIIVRECGQTLGRVRVRTVVYY